MSAFSGSIDPDMLKQALLEGAINVGATPGWDADTGHGVINAASAYNRLMQDVSMT